MSGKYIWKLLLTLALVGFSVSYLVPFQNRDFADYVRGQSDSPEFHALLDRALEVSEASAEDENEPTISPYIALRNIANEERIDISQFFTDLKLEARLKNIETRNNILLPELLDRSQANLKLGLDIQGGVSATFQIDPKAKTDLSAAEYNSQLADAVSIIERRINSMGVAEPVVRPLGLDRIEVQLAGVDPKNTPNLVDLVKKPAKLSFNEVHMTDRPGTHPKPIGYKEMTLVSEIDGVETRRQLYVKQIPALTGKHVDRAVPRTDEWGSIYVSLDLTDEGAELFADVTRKLAGDENTPEDNGQLGIILDGVLESAPNVIQEIRGGSAQITGKYTAREAQELSNILNNPLELPLEVAELYVVGPSLAKDAVDSGVKAALIGVSAVIAFMIIYFMLGGIVATISVAMNVTIVLGVLASFNATLTLPGIAGIILTVGMAVDANILIFERIREELKAGKPLKSALVGGFDKVFSTIFDANVTTLIVSVVMLSYGTGPVKGFGVTLAIGVLTTMFCALIVTRMLLELLFETELVKRFVTLSILRNPKMDFLKRRLPAFAASWTLVLVGIIALFVKWGDIWGVDFTGGDEVVLTFEEKLDESVIADALNPVIGEANPTYRMPLGGGPEELRIQTSFGDGDKIPTVLSEAFPDAGIALIGKNEIGPSIGAEIQSNAIKSIVISLGLILLYIAFRFEIGYGVGAVVATIHDVLLTIGVFVLVPDHQFTAPMVAAILLIVGYSLNDTIVLFDRIREELNMRPTMKLYDIINLAINAVLSRSLLTSITTLLASVSLMVFGTGVINDIAFTFTIGIITGTFSSIFIASPVFFFWHKGNRKSVETSHDVAPQYDWQASSKVSSSKASNS